MATRARLFPELTRERWAVWVSHPRSRDGAWMVIRRNLSHSDAVKDKLTRERVVSESGSPARFQILPEGEEP